MLPGLGHQPIEIVQRSQLRMNAGMPALFRSNGPGTADIIRLSGDRVVLAFSEGVPDGMDRRKIEDVEAHRGNIREAGFAVPQSSVPARLGRTGSRKYFIPGGVGRLRPVHDDA